eukprot:Pgem_evm1s17413
MQSYLGIVYIAAISGCFMVMLPLGVSLLYPWFWLYVTICGTPIFHSGYLVGFNQAFNVLHCNV